MSKYSLKKQLVVSAFLFAACILFACNSEFSSYAYEGDTTSQNDNETTGEIMSEVIDESDYILQEGGFLYEKPKKRMLMRSTKSVVNSFDEDEFRRRIKNAWDNGDTSVDIEDLGITTDMKDQLRDVYRSYINISPDYYFVSGGFSYSYLYTGIIDEFIIDYSVSDNERNEMITKYSDAISEFKKGVNSSWSDFEKIVYINDYLATLCEYDKKLTNPNCYNAYGVLVDHIAVCNGYSLAFNSLADKLGIKSYLVTSSTLNHAWNLVELNGNYYMLDVTWNDPTADRIGRARHYYLLKSYSWFNSTEGKHVASDYVIIDGISADLADDTKYDDYIWKEVDTPFQYINGYWYGSDGGNNISKYSCDGTDWIKEDDVISLSKNRWYVWGTTNSYYYTRDCVSLTSHNNNIIYSTPSIIYQYDFVDNKSTVLYELSDEEKENGYIYGLVKSSGNKLKYRVAQNPGSDTSVLGDVSLPSEVQIDELAPVVTIKYNSKEYNSFTSL